MSTRLLIGVFVLVICAAAPGDTPYRIAHLGLLVLILDVLNVIAKRMR